MTTEINIAQEQQTPLLFQHINDAVSLPSQSNGSDTSPPPKNQRLVSLDAFRGLTVSLMILVDHAGGAFPELNHSPWFGVTLADFVMPFFLFVVGVSISLSFKGTLSKSLATKKVVIRSLKLFLLGLLLQGGYFHGRHDLTYGVDLEKIRWLGVLQRISIGYFLASMSEIWLVNKTAVDSLTAFVRKYYVQWVVTVLLGVTYILLLYGLYVPNWEFELSDTFSSSSQSGTQIVHCALRGSLAPPCNAVGFIDRLLLGEKHLYQRPVYRRTKECSVNSPGYGPLPPNAPVWCLAPFDPEGLLSSLMAAVTCFIGLHFGHILVQFKQEHMQLVCWWLLSSFFLLISGIILTMSGIPLSKPLYTISYMCITTGVAGLCLVIIFYIVDVKNIKMPTTLLQWMGMNALIIYCLAACDIFVVAVQGFYWRSPEHNLVDVVESLLHTMAHSDKWGTLSFVFLEILFWCLVAGFLHKKGLYIKL